TLRHPAFMSGDTTTDFIERFEPARTLDLTRQELDRVLAAAALWVQGRNRMDATALAAIPSGWRNGRLPDQRIVFQVAGEKATVSYARQQDDTFRVARDEETIGRVARVRCWAPGRIDLEVDGRR